MLKKSRVMENVSELLERIAYNASGHNFVLAILARKTGPVALPQTEQHERAGPGRRTRRN